MNGHAATTAQRARGRQHFVLNFLPFNLLPACLSTAVGWSG
jgi:hypothetical protein